MKTDFREIVIEIDVILNKSQRAHSRGDALELPDWIDFELLQKDWRKLRTMILRQAGVIENSTARGYEDQLRKFWLAARGAWIIEFRNVNVPDWLQRGRKKQDSFWRKFFRELERSPRNIIEFATTHSGKSLAELKTIRQRWTLAYHRREKFSWTEFHGAIRRARRLRRMLNS